MRVILPSELFSTALSPVCVLPQMSRERAEQFKRFNRAEGMQPILEIVSEIGLQAVVLTTTTLGGWARRTSDGVPAIPHAPAHRVNPLADIAITHGGAGSVKTAIHSDTPLVGVPMQMEQAGNISLVLRQGAGVILSRLDLNRPKLSTVFEKLVTDKSYRDNVLRLKRLQDPIDGAAKAAREIVRFLKGDQPG